MSLVEPAITRAVARIPVTPKIISSGPSTDDEALSEFTLPTIYPFTQATVVPVAVERDRAVATSYGFSLVPSPTGSGPGPGPSPGSTPTYKLSI